MEYFERLSDLYGLACISQDMGIASADPDRLDEFFEIFADHVAVDPWEWEELADLVFESANLLIQRDGLNDSQKVRIVEIVFDHKDKFPNAMKYWLALEKCDYPIIEFIESGNQ